MTLHVEQHETETGEKRLVLVTPQGEIIAHFVSEVAVRLYTEQTALTWVFAHEVGRRGL